MPAAVAAPWQSGPDHPLVGMETAAPGPGHAMSLPETPSETFITSATVVLCRETAHQETQRQRTRQAADHSQQHDENRRALGHDYRNVLTSKTVAFRFPFIETESLDNKISRFTGLKILKNET